MPIDDPLPYLLTDRRALRTTVLNDGVWLNLRDVKRCFEARTYGTDDDIVVEADGVRWRIGAAAARGCAAEPICRRITPRCRRFSWVACEPSALVAGRRMTARDADALRRADALFATSPEPYCQTGF